MSFVGNKLKCLEHLTIELVPVLHDWQLGCSCQSLLICMPAEPLPLQSRTEILELKNKSRLFLGLVSQPDGGIEWSDMKIFSIRIR